MRHTADAPDAVKHHRRMGVAMPDVQLHRGGPICAQSANPTPAIGRLTVLLLIPVPQH